LRGPGGILHRSRQRRSGGWLPARQGRGRQRWRLQEGRGSCRATQSMQPQRRSAIIAYHHHFLQLLHNRRVPASVRRSSPQVGSSAGRQEQILKQRHSQWTQLFHESIVFAVERQRRRHGRTGDGGETVVVAAAGVFGQCEAQQRRVVVVRRKVWRGPDTARLFPQDLASLLHHGAERRKVLPFGRGSAVMGRRGGQRGRICRQSSVFHCPVAATIPFHFQYQHRHQDCPALGQLLTL